MTGNLHVQKLLPHSSRHRIISKYDIRGDFEAAGGMNSARRARSSEIHIPCNAEAKSFVSALCKIVDKKYGVSPRRSRYERPSRGAGPGHECTGVGTGTPSALRQSACASGANIRVGETSKFARPWRLVCERAYATVRCCQ